MSYGATTKLTEPEIAALRRYLDDHGHARAYAAIGLAKNTCYKALAGDKIARGTAVLIRSALALDAQQEARR